MIAVPTTSHHCDSQMDKLKILLERKVRTSVRVHGLLVPANSLQSRLHVFCQNLVRYTGIEAFPVQLKGSATGLNYRGKKFLACTAHQLREVREEEIGVLFLDENTYISSAGYTRFNASVQQTESDAVDLCVFDFTEQTEVKTSLGRRFFTLRSDDVLRDEDEVLGYHAYGCPFGDQTYDVLDNNHVGTVIRSMTCEPEKHIFDQAVGSCRLLSKMDFDPNGLSGGAVFATVLEGEEIALKFAGIINRAGGGIIHFIKAKAVQHLLNLSFA
ncbi:hypothetical protein [Rhizobium leguminosarum]|uniref:hypothetical protein n=1 Tax=Rhizobium TaxID=379 RepID=UPI00103141ED|nr:hypothetical protein [Rhizobium leguminosarum]TBF81956.1 hypothetical protein ELG86_07335 [Rhizobium leguminosarum]TBH01446.1 hypothetical protein ELG70_07325 [Rhizobium leguminosarum]TBH10983.1 hypothetical protein ELG68_07385 [Rhizobium leguminosarum]TBH35726.1 hypothetical protein ELG66_07385 [Rhizobium leguminosarum]TBH66181.1 hypothetical protein ELG61_07340 [Rhizobium leguminosarum]